MRRRAAGGLAALVRSGLSVVAGAAAAGERQDEGGHKSAARHRRSMPTSCKRASGLLAVWIARKSLRGRPESIRSHYGVASILNTCGPTRPWESHRRSGFRAAKTVTY